MSQNFQRQKNLSSKLQRGFLSIEVIVVLVVVLSLLALGASKMDLLGSSSDNATDMSNIQALYTVTKGTKSGSGYGASGTDLVPLLITLGQVPKNITISGNTLLNPYSGGLYTIVSNGGTFTISDTNMPATNCIKMAANVSKSGIFATTKINSGSAVSGEVTQATAAVGCNTATNTVAFTSAN